VAPGVETHPDIDAVARACLRWEERRDGLDYEIDGAVVKVDDLELQRSLGLSEPEAFRWIQKTAMDLRLSMRQVSEGVITHGPDLVG